MAVAEDKTILLWGDTQVGKTTFLAAAFYGEADDTCETFEVPTASRSAKADDFGFIDLKASHLSLSSTLFAHWERLNKNLLVQPTVHNTMDLDLTTRKKGKLRIRDVRGGIWRKVDAPEIQEVLHDANGVLFFVEWEGAEMVRHLTAARGAIEACADKKIGLIFTKCETRMRFEDKRWQAERGWWRESETLRSYQELMERFGECIWPVSAWGYNHRNRFPAIILGEFGHLLPFGIMPRGVKRPLANMFRELGLTP